MLVTNGPRARAAAAQRRDDAAPRRERSRRRARTRSLVAAEPASLDARDARRHFKFRDV
jgi:hypothetical protein